LSGEYSFCIGGQRIAGNWQWITGEQWGYANWAPGNNDDDLVIMYNWSYPSASISPGTWGAMTSSNTCNGYVIEYDVGDEPTGMAWVSINDPGVPGHEGFTGDMSKYETTNTVLPVS